MTMIYANGAKGLVHLIPVTQLTALCGQTRTDFHGCDGPVTCDGCLLAARAAFGWVLAHYADDVQSKATREPVVPLGHIDQQGRRLERSTR